MSDDPLVTIITPTYNRGQDYLKETIDSVLAQDYPNFEYIVLDDGSTDNTQEILQSYDDPRLKWESHSNMGETLTVNRGYQMAKGEFVMVVNSDDPVLPGFISSSVEFMQAHPDVLLTYSDWVMLDENSNVIKNITTLDFDYLKTVRWHYNFIQVGTMLRRKAIELEPERDPNFSYRSDYEYWLRVGLRGKIARIPKTLSTWRSHAGGATKAHRKEQLIREHIRVLDKLYSLPNMPPEIQKVRREAYSNAYYVAGELAIKNYPNLSRIFFLKSFFYCPLCWRQYPSGKWRSLKLILGVILLPRFLQKWLRIVEKQLRSVFKRIFS